MPEPHTIDNRRRGEVHRWSRTLIPTTRDAPADATTPSHALLIRAGFIRQVGAGIYTYLPLACRTLARISQIVREEMNAAGAAEMLMPALEPIELLAQTKRDVDYGELLFRLKDRHGRSAALAPTHEEVITDLLKTALASYKQLPLNLYQVQTKFRDEFRPRSALLRCREFIMKDAYSFHIAVDGPGGLNETYDAMHRAYVSIFTRCGLDFTVVEAESGPIGGSASHEFMVNCPSGEDTILRCPVSGYAANVEKCEIGERAWSFEGEQHGPLDRVHTPGLPGIDQVAEVLGVSASQMLKTVVFRILGRADGAPPGPVPKVRERQLSGSDIPIVHLSNAPKWVLAVVRGDHEVNEGKVKAASGYIVALADEREAKAAGFAIGYVSPRAIHSLRDENGLCPALLLIDHDAAVGGMAWATGADKPDYHDRNFNWRRELSSILDAEDRVRVADIRNARAGDPSPRAAGAALEVGRGIEVGHIFKLGAKYSEAMGLLVLDGAQQKRAVIMGCYGIGVSRTMAACVEMSHDADGIIWPPAIAPYHVLITLMKPDSAEQAAGAESLGAALGEAGIDVLIDDRDERPGVKFKDADLIGIPIRLTIGERALAEGAAEFKRRSQPGRGENVPLGGAIRACQAALNA